MEEKGGRLISIFGTKGGTGKTSLGFNLAACLAREWPQEVLLIDSAPTSLLGIASMLGLEDLPCLADLGVSSSPWGAMTLRQAAKRHPDGCHALGIRSSCSAGFFTAAMRRWLQVLRKAYAWTLLDTGNGGDELAQSAVIHSDLVLILLTPDLLSIEQARQDMQILSSLGVPQSRIHLVLNRMRTDSQKLEAEQSLGHSLLAQILEDPEAFGLSVLTRRSLFSQKPGAASRAVKTLAEAIIGLLDTDAKGRPAELKAQAPAPEEWTALKRRIRSRLLSEMDLKRLERVPETRSAVHPLRMQVQSLVMALIEMEDPAGSLPPETRQVLCLEVLDESLGYGPIQGFVLDPTITEIMVNGVHSIFVEREGRITETPRRFDSEEDVLAVMERILSPLGRRVDEQSPMADGRLPDGSRVNAIIRPLAIDGPALTIRKFSKGVMGPEDLLKAGSGDARMLEFLKACVQAKISILISGGTGSGKTTLLNSLSSFIPAEERILTIEDAAELLLQQPHVVRLESRPPNIEGRNQITIRQLVVNALRMRPSRIVVGECRAGEALDMLQAMNTGHAGSMTTLHANSPRDALNRLETLVLMAGEELPAKAIREQIASAIRIVVHLERFLDGSRRIVSIADLRGMKEGDFDLQEIFVYDRSKTDAREVIGRFQATGLVPSCLPDIERESIFLDRSLFGHEPVLVGTVPEGGLP